MTTTTGTITSQGIGSGLDVTSIISKIMTVENAPLTQLQTKATSIQSTISAFGAVTSAVSSFQDATRALTSPSTWSSVTGTSADPTSVTVSTSDGASAASYAIKVLNLAAAQSTVSSTYATSSALVGAGTLHFDIAGTGGFGSATSGAGVDVTATATDTLSTLSDKINAAGAGVTAAVVTDNTGSRLVLNSNTTGTAGAFKATGSGALGGLSFDPTSSSTGSTTSTQVATDAQASINGLTVTSGTNTLSNVLPGLTVNLLKATTTPVQVSVAQDTASIKAAITTFVNSYNSLSSLLSTDLKYDSSTSTAGPLQADSAAVSLQRQLRNILGSQSSASSTFSTLSQAGLQIQTDGTLKINDSTLSNALANGTQLKAMFAATSGSTSGSTAGFAQQFQTLTSSVLSATGTLTSRVAGLNSSLTSNQKDQDAMTTRLADTKARLQAQYTALDTKMASINTLSTYITQQIANWNKSG